MTKVRGTDPTRTPGPAHADQPRRLSPKFRCEATGAGTLIMSDARSEFPWYAPRRRASARDAGRYEPRAGPDVSNVFLTMAVPAGTC